MDGLVVDLDKNIQNRLPRLKPKGTPQVLTPSIKALQLLLALNPCGCGRIPARFKRRKQKTEKSGQLLFVVNSKEEMLYFFLFFACPVWAGGNQPQP
ncbi:MAG: hypothetical protein PUF44_08125 [Bacteroidales bacterium]|nr:hypothetical protein [Bacteroidales bacterium]